GIDVFEGEDASFLMGLRRGFRRIWSVADAEERDVGMIYRGALLSLRGQTLARFHAPAGAFVDHRGQTIAGVTRRASHAGSGAGGASEGGWGRDGASWLLTFLDVAPSDPFPRMVILAAVLSWGAEPE